VCSAEILRKQLEEAAQTKRVLEEAKMELSEKAKLVHIKEAELKELKLKVEMIEKTQARLTRHGPRLPRDAREPLGNRLRWPRSHPCRPIASRRRPTPQGAIKEKAAEADGLQAEVKRLIAKEKEAQRKFEVRAPRPL
jgi:hypothetical protein